MFCFKFVAIKFQLQLVLTSHLELKKNSYIFKVQWHRISILIPMRKGKKESNKQTQEKTGQMNLASDIYNGLIRDTRALPVQSPLLPFFVFTYTSFVYGGCLGGYSNDLTPSTSSHLHSILGFHKMILLDLSTENQIPIS